MYLISTCVLQNGVYKALFLGFGLIGKDHTLPMLLEYKKDGEFRDQFVAPSPLPLVEQYVVHINVSVCVYSTEGTLITRVHRARLP